ncbi:bile acid:sodium symporter [Marinilongibacter aquaticus]|uniref:bile acid:sodium symporter family protein n=1 Tax=Marinilongibacter aquaticus TaxID=2975157 RepID=UPI0021BDA910|nr:bile acid:sodium symporter family protein [Marinilongibacter aquaticus]UBM60200.1 bile acid:sodium symporter [Marinilongibacter aquaticus]
MKLGKLDPFIFAIVLAVLVAYYFPAWGSRQSEVPLEKLASLGVSLIFFFYGLKLSPEKVKSGLKNWRLHVLVQSSVFLLFPLIVLLFHPLVYHGLNKQVWLAFLFMAALPSTVSSSVVMVSIAKGNVPAAIFNASISGLIGIVLTPLWMGLFLEQNTGDFNLADVYLKLLTEILLPVLIGLGLHRFFHVYVQKYGAYLSLFDKSVILLIIYISFVHSFEDKVFESVDIPDLLLIYAAVLVLFFLVYFLIGFAARKLGFDTEDKITAQFCGTKKSLVHGTVFSKILFPASMPLGILLLPLMLFHASQIFIIGILASRLASRKTKDG